jgi:hypothetical protein
MMFEALKNILALKRDQSIQIQLFFLLILDG